MLKGFLALFTTGLIFKPMILLGGFIGIFLYILLDGETLKILYTDYHLYLLFLLIACLYAYFFKKTLQDNSYATEWKETIKTMIAEFFRLVFSFIIGMLLASFFDFSDIQIKPDSQDVKFSEYSEIVDMQKQARELMQNYDTLLNQAK